MSSAQPAVTTSRQTHRPDLVGMTYSEVGWLVREMVDHREDIMLAAGMLAKALNEGHIVWWFGNGGSAAQADHFAAELVGRYQLERPALGSVALGGATATMTAVANDYGYEQVFARMLAGCGRPGDVAVGLSTSGKSVNVLNAFHQAREIGMGTVLLTGAADVDYPAEVVIGCPGPQAAGVIQEQHLHLGHLLCGVVEQLLFGKRGRPQ